MNKQALKTSGLTALCGFVLLTTVNATAQVEVDRPQVQQAPQQRQVVLDEVIVTAQFRAQSLQDVPVSVNAIVGDKLFESGIDKIEDLQAYVPNLTMSETGIGTNIYIRGIGSGINPGFEQSVGMYFDGVSYGRAQLSRAPFLDLERVEVLRGPQNILFGKNSIAGAISLLSAKPTQEFEGMVSALYEPDHGETVFDLVLSGPLTDNVGARLAVRKRDMDGYIENLTLNRDEPQRDELTVRTIFQWDATPEVTATLKLEYGKFDVTGRQIEIVNDQPAKASLPFSGGDSPFPGRRYSEILRSTDISQGAIGIPGLFGTIESDPSVLNTRQNFKRSSNGDFSDNETKNITLNVDWFRGEHTFTFITALMEYEFSELCDCDFTGAEVFNVSGEEDYRQFSQEVRWISPVGSTWEFVGGGFYQRSELEFFDSINVPSGILPDLINAADIAALGEFGDAPADGDLVGGPSILPILLPGLPIGGFGDAGEHLRGLTSPRHFSTDTDIFSVFLQATWNIRHDLRATFGGRYSYEKKDGARRLEFFNTSTEPDTEQETKTVVAKNFSAEAHDLSGSRSEHNFSPSLNLQYDWNDDVMLYATASMGFKSGGYDARSNASPAADDPAPHNPNYNGPLIGSFEYDEERAISLELGAKSRLFNGAGELNIAAFFTQYDDLQVSIFDGTLGFNVGNAGEARTMGLELDGRLALSQNLMMTASVAYLNFEFTDFKNGQCYQDQDLREPGRVTDAERGLCDYKGKSNQYVADFSGNIAFIYTRPFANGLEFRGGVDFVFTSSYNPTQNLDPDLEQSGYVKSNARLAISDVRRGWEVAVVGKNLTDEAIISYANDTPLSNSIFGSKGHYAFIERPRSIALQGIYRW